MHAHGLKAGVDGREGGVVVERRAKLVTVPELLSTLRARR